MVTHTLNKLAYDLMELRRDELKMTDSLSIKQVKDWIQATRALLLRQEFSKPFRAIDDHLVQNLTNNGSPIQMEKVISNEASVDVEEYLYRTTIEIPRTIQRRGGLSTFTRIGPADKRQPKFNVVSYDRALVSGNGEFNRNSIYAYASGNYIYLTSKSGIHFTIKYIDVQGVFQDAALAATTSDSTWTHDDDYPINKSTIDQMRNIILKENFQFVMQPIKDKTDDQEENIEGGAKQSKK